MNKKGMVFGVFDGLHEGHKYLLTEAAKLCDELVVVVTLDEAVSTLKGHLPQQRYKERVAAITAFNPTLKIVEGDPALGEWTVLKTHKPDMVILGYDQERIAKELRLVSVFYKFVSAYKPAEFKSSIVNGTPH